MATLEETLQELQKSGKPVEISWLWDGGIDVNGGGEEMNFRRIADVLPWLQHWYGLGRTAEASPLAAELQKIYDSEIHVTIRTGGKQIFVALGTEFTGFNGVGTVGAAPGIVARLQKAIHDHYPSSKYDVERLGGRFTSEMAEIHNES